MTREEFIKQAQIVHQNKYSYDKVDYVNKITKVIIICPIHGEFLQTPKEHLKGRGCNKCAIEYRNKKNTSSLDKFIEKARKVHGDKYDYSKSVYTKSKEPILIICPIHGEFWQRPQDHYLKGCGCPKCKVNKIIETHSYTKDMFLKKAKDKFGNKFDYSKMDYLSYTSSVVISCPIHGDFVTTPKNHLDCETGCPKCGREKANISETYTKEDFVTKAQKIHYNKYDYSKVNYVNSHIKVTIICPKHGEFEQLPINHLAGQGCPKCKLKSQTLLYNKLVERFPNLDILFEVTNKIVPWLEEQRFDIYIPLLNIAIEYNGKQHYVPIDHFGGVLSFENTLYRDELKKQKCKNNNCLLLEVKYDYSQEDFENLCLEVTKQLEDFLEQFNNEESKSKQDEIAIEVGKLLVEQILYNTDDKANLIERVE